MSLAFAFHTDRWRVAITGSALADGTVLVEHSLNELIWETVRGGAAVPVAGGGFTLDDHEYTPGAQNHYRVTPVDPPGAAETGSITVTGHTAIILKSLRYPVVNRPVTVTEFTGPQRASRDGLFEVKGRSLPVAVHDLRGSQQFTLQLQTATAAAARDMDLILALGGTLLVHNPPNCAVPGGYISLGDTDQERRTRSGRSPRRYFSLPATVVAKPGPQITPTTLLWSTVHNTYGSWEALWAANPTWFDLYQSVGSLEDAVVL